MHGIHCVYTCAGDVYGATIEHEHDALGELAAIVDVHSGWKGVQANCTGWNGVLLAALWLIRRLILQWSSKSLSAYSAMLCSLLRPVIAVILSFGTPPFCNLYTCVFCTLMVCESLATVVKASLFCNCFHELLDFALTNWLLSVPQCWLRFFQGSQIRWTTCAEFCWMLTHLQFQQFHTIQIISRRKYLLHHIPVVLPVLPALFLSTLLALYIIGPRLPDKSEAF